MESTSLKRRCWAESLGGCDGLSKEHVFSQAAFRSTKQMIAVTGFASIPDGFIGHDSPKARILCRNHNSQLSELDSEVAKATAPLLDYYTDRIERSVYVSGFLFERWIYKVAVNFMAAGFADNQKWTIDEEIVQFVYGQKKVSMPLGMYMLREWKLEFRPPPQHVGACPVYFGDSHADAALIGVVVTYHGISFLACFDSGFNSMLEARDPAFPISPEILSYRPAAAAVFSKSMGTKCQVNFNWT